MLSKRAAEKKIGHLPPIDYRYGWSLSRFEDQLKFLYGLLVMGVTTLFASPSCHPWGANSRGTPEKERSAKRQKERPSLMFLAMCCFLQVLMGKAYKLENPAYSDIFTSEESPLKPLRELKYYLRHVDQCMKGAMQEGQAVRKGTHIQSNGPMKPDVKCDHSHAHLHLRGAGPGGTRTALAAMYPRAFCDDLLDDMPPSAPDGGRICPAPKSLMVVPESSTGTLKEETQGEKLTGGTPRPETGRAIREAGRGTPSIGGTSILSDGQPLNMILTVELALQNLQALA